MSGSWTRKEGQRESGGLNQKGVESYRRENPGSKLKTAVTKDPSKLKKGSKSAKRRSSFCSRMKGMKAKRTSAKTANDPNSRINKSLRAWNCEVKESDDFFLLSKKERFTKAAKALASTAGKKPTPSKVKKAAKAASVIAGGTAIGAGVGLAKNPGRRLRPGESTEGKVIYVRPRGMRAVKHYGVGLSDGKVLHRTNTASNERDPTGKKKGAINTKETFARNKKGKKDRPIYVDSETTLKGKELDRVAKKKVGTAGDYKTFDKNCETFVRAFSDKKARRRDQGKTAMKAAAIGGGAAAVGVAAVANKSKLQEGAKKALGILKRRRG